MPRKPKPLTLKNVVDALIALPGRRYNPGTKADSMAECMYTYEDGSHCLVGQALTDLGYEVPAFGSGTNQESVEILLRDLDIDHSDSVESVLTDVQSYADQGCSWSASLRLAGVK